MYQIKVNSVTNTAIVKHVNETINVTHAGRKGDKGDEGEPGQGVPAGGNTGQILTKDSNSDYDTSWQDPETQAVLWGGIGGDIENQTDLQEALDDKVDIDSLVYNVKDYGALGDGLNDDTLEIQATINAAVNGGVVYLPAGTYLVDPDISLNLTAGITFMGAGRKSVLKIKDNSDVLDNLVKVENADRVILKDFVIDGNRANQDPSDLVAVHYGVYIASSDNCRVENVYVHDTTGVGIHVYDSVGTVVTNCESTGNRYHGFECEQDTNTLWTANRGHNNTRHGIFISPGEVGGTGAIGNIIDGNSFDNNDSYGIAFGIDAAGASIGLTKDNAITNNSVTNNGEYGVSIYRVDDTLVANNVIAYNGFFGLYLYRAERNQIIGNRFRNNSQTTNGAYDEILLEGNNDGQASIHNLLSDNFIYIDGVNKANYAIREATSGDGPNVIKNNYIPNAGVSGRTLIQHVNTSYEMISDTPESNTSSLRTFDDGIAIAANATLPGGAMGLDAPFGTAALRFINNNSGGNIQYVSPNGNSDWYAGGNNVLSVTSSHATLHGYPLKEVEDPTDDQDAVTKAYAHNTFLDSTGGNIFGGFGIAPTYTNSSGTSTSLNVSPNLEQSGTAGYVALKVNAIETSTGSGEKTLATFRVGDVNRVSITNNGATLIQNTGGDSLTLDSQSTSNTVLRLKDGGTEQGAIFALNGSTNLTVRSQSNLVLTANNAVSAVSATLSSTGLTMHTGIPLIAGTSTDVLGTALSVLRNGSAVGRIDNNASGLRVQAQAGALQLRGTGNTGISIDSSGHSTFAGDIILGANSLKIGSGTARIYDDGNMHVDSGGNNMWLDSGAGNVYVSAAGSGSLGINTSSPSARLDINSDTIRLRTARTPASAAATGNQGDITWDTDFVYVCVATNTWKRAALSTW